MHLFQILLIASLFIYPTTSMASESLNRSLFDAVVNENATEVKRLLELGADPNWHHNNINSIDRAAIQGKADYLDIIHKYSKFPIVTIGNAYRFALEKKHTELALKIIDYWLNPNASAYGGRVSPMKIAIIEDNQSVVKRLLEKGMDERNTVQGLIDAAIWGRVKIVDTILKEGIDLNSVPYTSGSYENMSVLAIIVSLPEIFDYDGIIKFDKNKHLKIVSMLIEHGADINYEYYNNGLLADHEHRKKGNILTTAAKWSTEEVVELLQSAGANSQYETLLELANNGYLQAIKNHYRKGINITKPYTDSLTPLDRAAAGGHDEVVKYLLDQGEDIDAGKWTPLDQAIFRGHENVVNILLERGADPNLPNNAGYTPLLAVFHALNTFNNDKEARDRVLRELINHGADINKTSHVLGSKENLHIPIIRMIAEGHHDLAEWIISNRNVSLNVSDGYGSSPLTVAVYEGNIRLVEGMLKHGASINYRTTSGKTALSSVSLNQETMISLLLRYGAENQDGLDSALLSIAKTDNVNLAKKLIDRGADPNYWKPLTSTPPTTPLLNAASAGKVNMIRLLVKNGADVEKRRRWTLPQRGIYNSPLKEALYNNNTEAGIELLNLGASLEQRQGDADARHLHLAAKHGNNKLISLLVQKGASPDTEAFYQDYRFLSVTPLSVAAYEGHVDTARLLIELGADPNKAIGVASTKEIVKILREHGASGKAYQLEHITEQNRTAQSLEERAANGWIEDDPELCYDIESGSTSRVEKTLKNEYKTTLYERYAQIRCDGLDILEYLANKNPEAMMRFTGSIKRISEKRKTPIVYTNMLLNSVNGKTLIERIMLHLEDIDRKGEKQEDSERLSLYTLMTNRNYLIKYPSTGTEEAVQKITNWWTDHNQLIGKYRSKYPDLFECDPETDRKYVRHYLEKCA